MMLSKIRRLCGSRWMIHLIWGRALGRASNSIGRLRFGEQDARGGGIFVDGKR